jgi:hypothetical protein
MKILSSVTAEVKELLKEEKGLIDELQLKREESTSPQMIRKQLVKYRYFCMGTAQWLYKLKHIIFGNRNPYYNQVFWKEINSIKNDMHFSDLFIFYSRLS